MALTLASPPRLWRRVFRRCFGRDDIRCYAPFQQAASLESDTALQSGDDILSHQFMLSGLNHITLAVSQLDRALEFYAGLLGMRAHVRWHGGAYLSLGELWLCLSVDSARPAQDYTHLAFSVDPASFAACAAQLRQAGVVEWKQNRSEGDSLYFLDPDGHQLEIHCGDLQTRLQALRSQPYAGLIWLS